MSRVWPSSAFKYCSTAGRKALVSLWLMGRALFHEAPADADIVIGVPDAGISAAIGYARESGILYTEGLITRRSLPANLLSNLGGVRITRKRGRNKRLTRVNSWYMRLKRFGNRGALPSLT